MAVSQEDRRKNLELENDMVRVRYIGEDDPLMMLHGKVYEARVLKKGWYGVVDETHEEYAYPPELFELLPPDGDAASR